MTREELKEALNNCAVAYHDFMSAENVVARSIARRKANEAEDLLLAEFDRLTAKAELLEKIRRAAYDFIKLSEAQS